MASLEDGIRMLEDERAILRTMHTYSQSLDSNDEDAFVECFTEGARRHWGVDPGGPIAGRAAITDAFRAHTHPDDVFNKHLTFEPLITINGDRAAAVSYLAFVHDSDDGPHIKRYGCYHDQFVRCDDGRWRFVERRPEVQARRA